MKNILFAAIFMVFGCTSTPSSDKTEANLGNLNHTFPVSDAAKESFNRGLLLLHSFEYVDANEAFSEAIEDDPAEVMAYWGKTMTYYRALWGLQDVEAGRKVMSKLGENSEDRLAVASEGLERDFWEALEILYGDGDLTDRNQAYSDFMEGLYEKYPKNQEVAAFYSLGLMWSVPTGRDVDVYEKSATVAAGILQENPDHPGALHYMIHAYDDPQYAELATQAANKYSKVAPDATHALHMPSHIYLALGMWDEVVASNENSYGASISRLERKGLPESARGYHSYSWLHYGYLQQGRFEQATKLMEDMLGYTQKSPTTQARSYLIGMQNAQLAETGEWLRDKDPLFVDYDDLGLNAKSGQHFFRSMLAFEQGDSESILAEIDTLKTHLATAELLVSDDGIAICGAVPTRYAPNANSIKRTNAVINQMFALSSLSNGDEESAEKYFQKAVELESNTDYSFGPPDIAYPTFEHYGDWLLSKGRYEDAITQYNTSLTRAPKRAKALRGIATAKDAMTSSGD